MSNKLLITAIAAMMTVVTAAGAGAEVKKKKPVKSADAQAQEEANKELMDDVALGIATGLLGGAMKKAKMPKGGKLIMKQGLKSVKDAAKKSKKDGGGAKDSGKKKNPLNLLLGGGDEE